MYHHQPSPRTRPPQGSGRQPTRMEPVAGTPYGLAIYGPPPATSGPAVGSLVAGIAALLVSLVVACFGLADAVTSAGGQAGGWGALAGGAFAVLAGFLGVGGLALGMVGIRQTRPRRQPTGEPVNGRGMAIAGVSCGGAGLLITLCSLGVAIAVAVSASA